MTKVITFSSLPVVNVNYLYWTDIVFTTHGLMTGVFCIDWSLLF